MRFLPCACSFRHCFVCARKFQCVQSLPLLVENVNCGGWPHVHLWCRGDVCESISSSLGVFGLSTQNTLVDMGAQKLPAPASSFQSPAVPRYWRPISITLVRTATELVRSHDFTRWNICFYKPSVHLRCFRPPSPRTWSFLQQLCCHSELFLNSRSSFAVVALFFGEASLKSCALHSQQLVQSLHPWMLWQNGDKIF